MTRDVLIVVFALTMGVFEITLGGGRAAVLTFLTTLIALPFAIRVDELRRRGP